MKFKAPTLEPVYLSSTQGGHTHVVFGDAYSEVPTRFRAGALAAGCTFEGQAPDEEEAKPIVDPKAAELLAAVKQLLETGDAADFTANGKPSATRLTQMVGYTVTSEQRDAAWEAASQE